jgi:hypothetical protein
LIAKRRDISTAHCHNITDHSTADLSSVSHIPIIILFKKERWKRVNKSIQQMIEESGGKYCANSSVFVS